VPSLDERPTVRTGLQSGVFVDMKVGCRAVMRMPAKQMAMPATGSAELAVDIKKPEEQQRPSGDPGKPGANPVMQRNSEPGDEHPQERGKQHVTGTRQRRNANRLVPIPSLRPGRDDERQPVRGNSRVKESDTESRERDRGKNRFVHEARNSIIIRTILEHGEQTSTSGSTQTDARRSLTGRPCAEGFMLAFLSFMGKIRTNGNPLQVARPGSFQPWRVLSQTSVSMSRILCSLPAVAAALLFAVSLTAEDEDQPQGRVCLSIVDSGPSAKEEPFRLSEKGRPGSTLRAHIDASNKCTVLIAALTKDGKLANGWRPQLSDVPADFEEVQLPKTPVTWEWSGAHGAFDLYILFLPPGSKEVDEAKKLVAAMQAPKIDDRLLTMQANKLRELVGRITNEREKVNQAPMTEPELGGVFRGAGVDAVFPWREFAQSINFAENRPGVLVLSSEGAAKDSPAP
jgi:hypothetical protein